MTVAIILSALVALLLLGGFLFSRMPGKSFSGYPPPLTAEEERLKQRLKSHVEMLANQIGERHIWRPEALDAAADYIVGSLQQSGYNVIEQDYKVDGVHCRNIVAELSGTLRVDEILVVGAHYDTVPGTPGANDNGSGIALLLETARTLAGSAPERTIRFVAFVNEEPPFFKTDKMGSRVFAEGLKREQANIVGMFSLETVGYYDERPNSQEFPLPLLRLFYPTRGNFIAFVSNFASRPFLHRSLEIFRQQANIPSEGIAAPGKVTGVDWSDHWSFWQAGYPAVMVTDTALFRYEHYHDRSDTPDNLDYEAMTRLSSGFYAMLQKLAGVGHEQEL